MVGLRLLVDTDRVITSQERGIDAIDEMKTLLEGGIGPKSMGELPAAILEKISADIEPYIERLEDSVAALDQQVSRDAIEKVCSSLAEVGYSAVAFLRHLSPEKAVLDTLIASGLEFLSPQNVERLVECGGQLARLRESLHEVHDWGAIISPKTGWLTNPAHPVWRHAEGCITVQRGGQRRDRDCPTARHQRLPCGSGRSVGEDNLRVACVPEEIQEGHQNAAARSGAD